VRFARSVLVAIAFAGSLALTGLAGSACTSQTGDRPVVAGAPPPGGKDKRIRELADPTLPDHAALVGTTQAVSGAVVIAVDTFDETLDGNGTGDVFVQDLGATIDTPYAGINLFAPTFNPGNLAVSPGDVLDMRGVYQENAQIPSTPPIVFPPGSLLVQLAQPTATFRYETAIPEPVLIPYEDLLDFEKGRRWVGMLVRVEKVPVLNDPLVAKSGRVSVDITPGPTPFVFCGPKPATTIVNALYPIDQIGLKKGQTVASVTGVVLFFCNLQLAPRSAADIQLR
jgi:hypothetical protein